MPQAHARQRARVHSDADEERAREKKRIRVSRACDECRRRKDRCDGQQPACRPCTEGSRQCNYNPMKKRGLPPGYVRALEMLLGLVFRSIKGGESSILALLRGEVEAPCSAGSPTSTDQNSAPIECLLDTWRRSAVLKEVEKMLLVESADGEDASGQTLDDRFALAFSATMAPQATMEPTPIPSLMSDYAHAVLASPSPALEQVIPSPTTFSRQDYQSTMCTEAMASLPSNWFSLLDIYFANTHCWFPIAQKHESLRTAHLLANRTTSDRQDSIKPGERAFLWAIFAYTSQQCNALGIALENNDGRGLEQGGAQSLQREAESLATLDGLHRDIDHVRALMILALLQVGCQCWTKAWLYIGQAVYLAVDLGLASRTASRIQSSHDDGPSRTILGCFVLETLVAAQLRRRPYLRRPDVHLVALQANGIEEWETWQPSRLSNNLSPDSNSKHPHVPGHTLSIFNSLSELVVILNDIISQPGGEASRNLLFEASQNLDRWRDRLPQHCQEPFSRRTSTGSVLSPQLLNICIAFSSISVSLRARIASAPDESSQARDIPSKIGRSLDFISLHLQDSARKYMPAVFELYVSALDGLSSIRTTSLDDDLVRCSNASDVLRIELEKTWRGVRSSQNGLTRHPPRTGLSLSYDTLVESSSHRLEAAISSALASHAPESATLRDCSSDTRDSNDDALFNSLTLLDPVDWSANPPEFLERLGLPCGVLPADFESLFSPGTIQQ